MHFKSSRNNAYQSIGYLSALPHKTVENELTDQFVQLMRMSRVIRESELTTLYGKRAFTKWESKKTQLVQKTSKSLKIPNEFNY